MLKYKKKIAEKKDICIKVYKREIENKIIKLSETFRIIALTGPRQVGKSTLLDSLMPKNLQRLKKKC